MDIPTQVPQVPNPQVFRAWLQDSLSDLGVSAARLSKECDLGRNYVTEFLREQGSGVSLSVAHDISAKLHEIARGEGKSLPTMGAFNG